MTACRRESPTAPAAPSAKGDVVLSASLTLSSSSEAMGVTECGWPTLPRLRVEVQLCRMAASLVFGSPLRSFGLATTPSVPN